MQFLYNLIINILGPEASWSLYARKVFSLILVAGLGAYGWKEYEKFTYEPPLNETPIERILERPGTRQLVQRELNILLSILPNAESVWLYSWPDARHLDAVMSAGEGPNPMPLGYLRDGDEAAIGHYVLGKCERLERSFVNISCPINGDEDAWGVLIVVYDSEPPARPNAVKIVADKISSILYK